MNELTRMEYVWLTIYAAAVSAGQDEWDAVEEAEKGMATFGASFGV